MNYLLSILTAILLVALFPQWNMVWLAPVAVTPLLVACAREVRWRRRFLMGWLCGIVYWFGVCSWIEFVLAVHGGLGAAGGWAVFLLLCFAKALHMAVFAVLAGWAMRTWWALFAAPALWVAVEFTHGYLGFAWLALGNAGSDMGIPMRLAPYTGVYGVSFVFMTMACALALAMLRRPRRQLLMLLVLPLLILLPPLPETTPGDQVAGVVQPNVPETGQWTKESADLLHKRLAYLSLTVKAPLIVWPEMPAPVYYDEDATLRGYVQVLARSQHAYLLFGTVGRAADGGPLNSAQLVSDQGEPVSRYDKIKRVPFGEFVPWPFGFANKISTEVGDFRAGDRVVVSPVGAHKIGTFICYESVFPHLVRRFVQGGAEVLFNLSNDGYFGRSSAREQHLQIVRMRAAENRRWIVRATNDGITAVIDTAGRVRGTLPSYVEVAAQVSYGYETAQTVYTRWGDWFAGLCALLAALSVWAGARVE